MFIPKVSGVYLAVFAANILIFVVGTALSWSSPEIYKLNNATTSPFDESGISPEQSSWIASLVTLGAVVGPFIFGYLADRIGRKSTLLFIGVPFFVCYLALGLAQNVETFYVARFISGIAVGGAFTVLPMYIGEVTEKTNRGALSSSMSCFCCLGLLFSVCLGPYVSVRLFNLVLAISPVTFLVLFFLFGAESPLYLVKQQDNEMAKNALEKLGRSNGAIEREMEEMLTEMKDENEATFWDIFRSKGLIKAFVTSVGILTFQQLSGINAVVFYSTKIFHESGTMLAPEYCTIIVVGVQFLSSFFTPLIVDRYGRKIILFYSAVGMAVSEIPLGTYCYLKNHDVHVEAFSYVPIVTLTTFIIFFNLGFGPLPWVILSELFPASVKSSATALVSAFIWFMSFLTTKYFEWAVSMFGLGELFLFFGFCCALASLFSIFYVVETKGKSLQEIQEILSDE